MHLGSSFPSGQAPLCARHAAAAGEAGHQEDGPQRAHSGGGACPCSILSMCLLWLPPGLIQCLTTSSTELGSRAQLAWTCTSRSKERECLMVTG